jgi:hypothetical protein
MTINLALPHADVAGDVNQWYLPVTPDGTRSADYGYYVTYARFLGLGTSFTASHAPHERRFVDRGVRCNACRWFEARIFRELLLPAGVDDLAGLAAVGLTAADVELGGYVMHFVGMSIVDDEVPFCRVEQTTSPFTVVESMTTRRTTERGPEAFIAKPAAHALAEAAAYDRPLADAYVNRAVS